MNQFAFLFRASARCIVCVFAISSFAVADEPIKGARPGIFVAVGYGGRRMISHDGINWEHVQQWADKGADDWNNLISIAYGKGKFVAVGGGGWSRDTQAGHILVSTDGIEWREVKKVQFRISPILFDGSRFVAGAPDHQVLWSDDGENWSPGAKIEVPAGLPAWAMWFRGAAVKSRTASSAGTYVFCGNANKDQKTWWCLTTHDGQTAASFAADLPEVRRIVFGADKFLIVSTDSLHTSPDGQKWTKIPTAPTDKFRDAIWTGKEFLLNGKDSCYTSPDGLTWTAKGKPSPCGLVWSDGSIYIGTGWPGQMFSSVDGLTWTKGEKPKPEMGVNQIAYGVPGEKK